jgi:hypothetical protein
LGIRKRTTPFADARSAIWISSFFSFLSVNVGRESPMSMEGRFSADSDVVGIFSNESEGVDGNEL